MIQSEADSHVNQVVMAYVDESGDTGFGSARSSATFTLGCVLVRAHEWGDVFEDLLAFRKRLRDKFFVPVRAEIKASHLIRGAGPLKSLQLSPTERGLIYRAHFRHMARDGRIWAFAVVGHKEGEASGPQLLESVWQRVLQRLERTSRAWSNSRVMIVHDEGENPHVRRIARRARRRLSAGSQFGTGSMDVPFTQLIDDPFPKASHESFFLQLADLVAYGAWRRLYAPSARVAQVVPQSTWSSLGPAVLSATTWQKVMTVPGIVEITT